MAKDIGSDDCIKDDDCLFACLTKHDQHDSIQNIKLSMESNYMHVDFNFHTVHTEVVKSHLLKLKCNKATGYDLLPAKLLRMGSDILCNPISYLLNMSLKVCKFPSSLKYAEICPVFKNGNNIDVSNYRPVSILPRFLYILRRYLVHISGFRQNITVLVRMVENIKKSVEAGKVVCVVLMDLSRAFDCIPYTLFLSKLHVRAYGFSHSASRTISQLLSQS